jgi:ATP/maltotriose-dependent transcriptional regulator MalT
MSSADQFNWFPQTKLYPPQISSEVLHRPRLIEAVYQAITTKHLTLLSAPAGAGKTTAIASIHHHYPDLPLAWLTLDEQDNDVLTFFKVVLAAIQRCFPNCGQTLQMVLDTPAAANIEAQRLMTLLINDILEQSPETFVLVCACSLCR